MSIVADRFFGTPSRRLKVIGITGTNGKTTTNYMITHIMQTVGRGWGNIGTIGYHLGSRSVNAVNTTPNPIDIQQYLAEMINSGLDGCAMEVSSHALTQYRCDDVQFAGAVFTNLTQAHLDYHADLESYFKAKARLFYELLNDNGFAAVNIDDTYGKRLAAELSRTVLTFSSLSAGPQHEQADVQVDDKGFSDDSRRFMATYKKETIEGSLPLLGVFNLANAAAAITAALGVGVSFKDAVTAMADFPQVPGRVEQVKAGQPFDIIIDYAHTPDALQHLLAGLNARGRKLLVFGCGGDRDTGKRPLMGRVAADYADSMFVTSDNPRSEDPKRIINDILKGIPGNKKPVVIVDRSEAIKQALTSAKPADMVIIAGKGHEDYQIVGNTRRFFSDPVVVRQFLRKMGYAGA